MSQTKFTTKGTAYTESERESLGLSGMLPPAEENLERQTQRALARLREYEKPLDKYSYLASLHEQNATIYYRLLVDNIDECMPLVYTPTVGDGCLQFHKLFQFPQGMYISPAHKGKIRQVLDNWKHDVDIIVLTDGSRILGLGDLGANGMGIPIGKLALYVAASGFDPAKALPICFDVGTNNEELLQDELYMGVRAKRLTGDDYSDLMEELVMAIKDKWPGALLQFEDFSNEHAFSLLDKYRDRILSFNDDIQGTGAVIASGILSAVRIAGLPVEEHRFAFLGAGSAGIGVAEAICRVLQDAGMSENDARKRFYFLDSNGLITTQREAPISDIKAPWAHDLPPADSLLEVIKRVKPTALIGLSGIAGSFDEECVKELAKHADRPIIFPLSNPTSKAECTAAQAYGWTDGKCLFAAGSPFPPVNLQNGTTHRPSQGNNMYIFPGLGFGAVQAKATAVSEKMIHAAAVALADMVSEEEIAKGSLYPPIDKIRDISANVAAAVAQQAVREGLATADGLEGDLVSFMKERMYDPAY